MSESFSKGLEGVVAAQSSICLIDGERGELSYRGYSIEDLTRNSTFEEVAYVLLFGSLPTKSQLFWLKAELAKHMVLAPPIRKIMMSLPRGTSAMAALRTCVSTLAAYDRESEVMSVEANRRKALRILGVMPSLVANMHRVQSGKKIVGPKKELGVAGNFLYMLHGRVPSKDEEKVMDVCLILHAEHGLNASTFAARVTVSTLADLYSGVVSAIGTLKGPLHGGANKQAIQALHYLGGELHVKDVCEGSCLRHVDKYVLRLLKQHQKIMGIGHRVYKAKDPRAIILEQYASKFVRGKKYFQMAKEIERVMAEEKKLYPNVDFFSGIV